MEAELHTGIIPPEVALSIPRRLEQAPVVHETVTMRQPLTLTAIFLALATAPAGYAADAAPPVAGVKKAAVATDITKPRADTQI